MPHSQTQILQVLIDNTATYIVGCERKMRSVVTVGVKREGFVFAIIPCKRGRPDGPICSLNIKLYCRYANMCRFIISTFPGRLCKLNEPYAW